MRQVVYMSVAKDIFRRALLDKAAANGNAARFRAQSPRHARPSASAPNIREPPATAAVTRSSSGGDWFTSERACPFTLWRTHNEQRVLRGHLRRGGRRRRRVVGRRQRQRARGRAWYAGPGAHVRALVAQRHHVAAMQVQKSRALYALHSAACPVKNISWSPAAAPIAKLTRHAASAPACLEAHREERVRALDYLSVSDAQPHD